MLGPFVCRDFGGLRWNESDAYDHTLNKRSWKTGKFDENGNWIDESSHWISDMEWGQDRWPRKLTRAGVLRERSVEELTTALSEFKPSFCCRKLIKRKIPPCIQP